MSRKKISSVLALIGCLTAAAAIVLEALPDAAVLVFGTESGSVRVGYSYFDTLPFGYADVWPLLTAILTCAAAAASLASVFCRVKGLVYLWVCLAGAAVFTSFLAICSPVSHFTAVGLAIFLVSAAGFAAAVTSLYILFQNNSAEADG